VTPGGGFVAQICRPGRQTCDQPVDRVPLTSFTVEPERTAADPGQTVALDARFAVDEFGPVQDVSLTATAPDGWSIEGSGARAAALGTGESLAAGWSVTVPPEPEYGFTDIPVVAEFSVPGGPSRLRVEKLVRVFVSPPGVDYVSDLPFVSQRNGWGPVERDTSNGENQGGDGGPLRIRGTTYDKGLGAHALSEVTVDIGGAYERFTAQVGLDDEVTGPGSVAFEVIGDGAVLARTGVLRRADPAQPIDVDVTGVETLTLRVTDGGDGINFDHGDWGDAQLRLPD
jgi:alpha-glucosidase